MIKFAADQFVGGVRCTQPQCQQFLHSLPADQLRLPAAARVPSLAAWYSPEAIATACIYREISVDAHADVQCSHCGHRLTAAQFDALEKQVCREWYLISLSHHGQRVLFLYYATNQIDTLFAETMQLYNKEGRENSAAVQKRVEATLHELIPYRLHPLHEDAFQLQLMLINLCGSRRDWNSRLEYVRTILLMAEQVFPRYYLPRSSWYHAKAATIQSLLEAWPIQRRQSMKTLFQHYVDE